MSKTTYVWSLSATSLGFLVPACDLFLQVPQLGLHLHRTPGSGSDYLPPMLFDPLGP